MPYDLILMAHHVSAFALFGFVVLGLVASRLPETTRATLFPVEGMGGLAAVLFQLVSGANLSGRAGIPWATPWVTATLLGFLLAVVVWLVSLARRAKTPADRMGSFLNAAALLALLGCYGLMAAKPALW